MAFDQDAVDEAVRILRAEFQPQIDELKARPIARRVVKQVLHYEEGPADTFDLAPAT